MPPMPVDVDSARRQAVTDAVRATGRIEAMQELNHDHEPLVGIDRVLVPKDFGEFPVLAAAYLGLTLVRG